MEKGLFSIGRMERNVISYATVSHVFLAPISRTVGMCCSNIVQPIVRENSLTENENKQRGVLKYSFIYWAAIVLVVVYE